MNLVDEADLLALMEEEAADAYTAEKEAAAQAEQDKLKAEEEAKKAEEEAATAEPPKENKITKYAGAFLGIVALIALAAGGGFYFYRQQMQKKQAEKKPSTPMQTTPRTRAILRFLWRMNRKNPARKIPNPSDFKAALAAVHIAIRNRMEGFLSQN